MQLQLGPSIVDNNSKVCVDNSRLCMTQQQLQKLTRGYWSLQGTPEGTPDSKAQGDAKTLSESVDKDGKPLPQDPVASKALKVDTPKPKKADPVFIPQGPLKSKYHIQVGL